jgi:hypothetical protein
MGLIFRVSYIYLKIHMPKHNRYTFTIMASALYINRDDYGRILEWGQNSSDEWYHPVSRSQFTQGLHLVKAGDIIEFILDGVSSNVQVVEVGTIYEYPLLRHANGDFNLTHMRADRVIRVKRV